MDCRLLHMFIYLLRCSSQSSGGGGLSATVRANRTCRSHSFITLRALWLSYSGTGVGVTVSTSIKGSDSLQTNMKMIQVNEGQTNIAIIKLLLSIISQACRGTTSNYWSTDLDKDCWLLYSRRGVWLATGIDKQGPCGPGTAGIRVCIPRLGITMIQKHQVQFSFMSWQLE